MDPVVIESLDEIRSLHRLLFKYKFQTELDDEFIASPHIASLQRVLFRALQAENPGGWAEWADVSGHAAALEQFAKHTVQSSWWSHAEAEARRSYVRDYFSPLSITDDAMARLIS